MFVKTINSKLGFLICAAAILCASCSKIQTSSPIVLSETHTISSGGERIGEPFGVAVKDDEIFISDGDAGKIWRVAERSKFSVVTDKLQTPSAIAFDADGNLIVADSGAHQIKRINVSTGAVEAIAGVENKKGFADGDAKSALFDAPIGIAVSENKIFVADTYNDKIRVIENGRVATLAGGERGFADAENGLVARFDTPCGLAIWQDKLLVADLENRRVRVVEMNGKTWTLAGNDSVDSTDGFLPRASFAAPTALTVDASGLIYVADDNAIRVVGRRLFPTVETLTNARRGFADGDLRGSRFNRPSGLAFDASGNLFVADAENQAVRILTNDETGATFRAVETDEMRVSAEEFRSSQPPRWAYNPPDRKREIAGTLGEIRGEIKDDSSEVWFHNGLDIVGGYGETARFVRTEKVLRPVAVENFDTLRELIRMPTLGYIHIRLGRDKTNESFADNRFEFSFDASRKLRGVRVPRGSRFEAGEAVGTLNPMNHVHLIAGRSGAEMNALDALILPNVSDSVPPKIEQVALYDENWNRLGETESKTARIKLAGKTRVVVRAFDRMDGNAERRRLGAYRIGYQIMREGGASVSEIDWTISFDRLPDERAVKFVYARGSKSGATGETIFDYIATNRVNGDSFAEDFFDASRLENGNYVLRVFAADFFGNMTSKDLSFER